MRDQQVQTIGAITIDGAAVTHSQRVLVAALALARSTGATMDMLIDAAWRDDVPRSARKSVQNQIVRLRHEFGADLIVTSGDRYLLSASTDIDAIDRVVDCCDRVSLSRTEAHEIARVLASWNGEPYTDLLDNPLAEAERARLHHVRTRLVETLAVHRMCDPTADSTATIVDLTVRTSTDPLHEQAWELLVGALHVAGRRTEALGTYARFCDVLDTQLGAVPSRRFQQLYRTVDADQPVDPRSILAPGSTVAARSLRATA